MTKPTIAELQREFDKRLKTYAGNSEVTDLWLPYVDSICGRILHKNLFH